MFVNRSFPSHDITAIVNVPTRSSGTTEDNIEVSRDLPEDGGILSGRVEIGLPPGSTVLELFEQIQRELDAMRRGVIIEQENARLRDD